MTNEELNEAIRYLEEERLTVEAILYGENQDKFDNTIMLIDDAKFRLSRKPLTIYDMAIKALEQTRWIPISERLPEEDGFYLATCDGEICGEDEPFSGLAEFENGKWTDDEEGYQCVLAWQPLPEPYKAESEKEE